MERTGGRWEQIFEVNGFYESYNVFDFKADGTFHWEGSARDLETGETIGFRGVADGSYQVQENIITITEKVLLSRDYDDPAFIDDNSFFPKSDLIPNDNTSEISYRIVNNFTELNFICPADSPGCIEFTTYIKVSE